MRKLALVTISLIGVIALLDVAASWAINGSVDVPFLLVLVVAAAILVQTWARPMQLEDLITLERLRRHAAALARIPQSSGVPTSPGRERECGLSVSRCYWRFWFWGWPW